jgi:uncharacterized protein (TIGR02145 family)
MKKILLLISPLLFVASTWAQTPQKMSYQAVIRNSSAQLITNTKVGMQISILHDSLNGPIAYSETQTPTTNANGLINIEIGSEIGFDTINWVEGPYFLKTETDPTGGTNYTITGISQLLSVPYALHAQTAENISGTINYNETDPVFNVSTAKGIKASDTVNWNNKLDSYAETQNLADVLTINDSANGQIKNVTDPTDAQDAATKAYVDALSAQFNLLKNTVKAGGPLIDIEGNVYNVVKIDTQVWMAENLKVTKFNDGTPIPLVADSSEWVQIYSYAYCWPENDEIKNKDTYGALYNWFAVSHNLCPTGWHLPSDAEWAFLIDYLGGGNIAGSKLKETGTTHWHSPNAYATNETGFTALPAGTRVENGIFSHSGITGEWWSSTFFPKSEVAWTYYVAWYDSRVGHRELDPNWGLSVRCLKD